MRVIGEEEYADAERDAVALIGVIVAGDWQAVAAFARHGNWPVIFTAVLNLLFDELAGHGTDPEEWVAGKQAALRARLAERGT